MFISTYTILAVWRKNLNRLNKVKHSLSNPCVSLWGWLLYHACDIFVWVADWFLLLILCSCNAKWKTPDVVHHSSTQRKTEEVSDKIIIKGTKLTVQVGKYKSSIFDTDECSSESNLHIYYLLSEVNRMSKEKTAIFSIETTKTQIRK